MRLYSLPIDTGSARPLPAVLKSLISRASKFTIHGTCLDYNLCYLRSIVDELKPAYTDVREDARQPECVSIAWSADGQTLFAGFTDNVLRVWTVTS